MMPLTCPFRLEEGRMKDFGEQISMQELWQLPEGNWLWYIELGGVLIS